jgi:hypothetical protein
MPIYRTTQRHAAECSNYIYRLEKVILCLAWEIWVPLMLARTHQYAWLEFQTRV